MKRTEVSSSNIAAIGYDPDVWVLEVEFRNGSIYQYAFVPPELHQDLVNAQSIGAFLNANIKPHRAFRRVEAAESAL